MKEQVKNYVKMGIGLFFVFFAIFHAFNQPFPNYELLQLGLILVNWAIGVYWINKGGLLI